MMCLCKLLEIFMNVVTMKMFNGCGCDYNMTRRVTCSEPSSKIVLLVYDAKAI